MPLTVGARLGPYEITGMLGVGGPSFVRGLEYRELRRGLAAAKERPR